MEYRFMTIKEYDEVYALWLSCKGMGLNNIDDSKMGIETFLRRNPTTCFVCLDNQEIIGAIIAGHDGRRGYIYHTAVKTTFRHQHFASKLVYLALNALKEEGIH